MTYGALRTDFPEGENGRYCVYGGLLRDLSFNPSLQRFSCVVHLLPSSREVAPKHPILYAVVICPTRAHYVTPFFVLGMKNASFASVKEVASFATLPQSFESMMYVIMFSNWPMFMDAAAVASNPVVAKIFFYSCKIIGFYFLFPVRQAPGLAGMRP